ncbi:aminotransferase class V-fold PLP-dependent enzyme [Inquilinus limosus]|uniref:Class V aminotransferase n=1 Tax=Inquilinus limosus MP06 TaxID=1398085 RepID=A0A0A0DGH3_9PROT|nr:aminotransferase class V-fold PLP-dependent enzyme [Inquilinus limosus]KGM36092.1 class V aminotransferase [Inquilinus limosus MP06]
MDLARLRAETPGIDRVLHFNHAGSSLPPQPVLDTVLAHLQREAVSGPIEAGQAAAPALEEARADAAALIGATPAEIAFTGSATQGWGLAFAGLVSSGQALKAGDRILVARQEWGGNLTTMQRAAARTGAVIEAIPCDDTGRASPEALAAMIDDRVRLVSLTWIGANGGLINPAAEIGRVARAAGVPYYIDASQAIGQLPIDVAALGCDVLIAPGRKHLRGPRGTGLLYVRRDFLDRLDPPYHDARTAAWTPEGARLQDGALRFEAGDFPMALRLGLGTAIRYAGAIGIDAIRARLDGLAQGLRARLAAVSGVTLHDRGVEQAALVSFAVEGVEPSALRRRLAADGITIAVNGVMYTPLDMTARGLGDICRAAVSYLHTEAELDRLAEAVAAARS